MKSIRIAALCIAAMSMSACAAVVPALGVLNNLVSVAKPAAAVGDKVVLEGTRGLILAHNAFQGALAIVTPLIRARILTSGQVDMVEVLVNQAERLFDGADASLTVAQRAASLMLLANQMTTIASAGQPNASADTVREQVAGLRAVNQEFASEAFLPALGQRNDGRHEEHWSAAR
jgi:hypothetical protein